MPIGSKCLGCGRKVIVHTWPEIDIEWVLQDNGERTPDWLISRIKDVFWRYKMPEDIYNALTILGFRRVYSWRDDEIWAYKDDSVIIWLSWVTGSYYIHMKVHGGVIGG